MSLVLGIVVLIGCLKQALSTATFFSVCSRHVCIPVEGFEHLCS